MFVSFSPLIKPERRNGLQNQVPRVKVYLAMWFDLQSDQNFFQKYTKHRINSNSCWMFVSFSPLIKPDWRSGLQNQIPRVKLYLVMWFDPRSHQNFCQNIPNTEWILILQNVCVFFTFDQARTAQRATKSNSSCQTVSGHVMWYPIGRNFRSN